MFDTDLELGDAIRAIALSVLMVLAIPTMLMGVGPVGSHDGVASAEEDINVVYSGSHDNTVKALDVETGDEIWTSNVHNSDIWSVASDGDVVYSGSSDNTVGASDADTGDEIWTSTAHTDIVYTVAADGDVVYSGSADNTVKALDADTGDEIWTSTAHTEAVLSVAPDGDVVYSGSFDDTVKALDADTGDEIWTSTAHSGRIWSVASDGDVVYSGSWDNTVKALDADTGDEIWTSNAHTDNVNSVAPDGDVVYSASHDDTVKALDADTGDEIWTSNAHTSVVYSVASDGDVVYSGSNDGTAKALDADTGDEIWTSFAHSDTVYSVAPDGDSGEPISGQVVDQSGSPVSDATVEVYRADEDEIEARLDVSADESEEKAEALLRESRNIEPDAFDTELDLLDDEEAYGDADEAVLVHDASEWSLSGYETRLGVLSRDLTPELGGPEVTHSADDPLVLSVWEVGATSIFEDDVDSSVAGAQTIDDDREIVIEQVHGESSVRDRTVETREFVEVTDFTANGGTKTHYATTVDLPRGFYRVYLEGSPERSVYHSVGDPADVAALIEDDLTDEADQYSSKAEEVRDRLSDGIFEKQRVTTNATGHFEIELSGKIAIQAYKSDAPNVDPSTHSLEDVREIHKTDEYLGTMVYSPTAKQVDTRDLEEGEIVEVGTIRAETPLNDLDLNDEIVDRVIDHIENQTAVFDELDMTDGVDRLEETRDTLLSIVEGSADAEEVLVDTFDEHETDGSIDLRDRSEYDSDAAAYEDHIYALRYALENTPSTYDPEIDGEIGDDVLDLRLSAGGVLDGASVEDVEVLAHYQDGTTETIGSEYWHIESSVGGDVIVVEDYPIGDDRAHATVEVLASDSDGEVVRGSERFDNPAFDGDHLDFSSLVASNLSPGPSETVTLAPRISDDSSAELVGATVRSPDGSTKDATVESDVVRFETEGEGDHAVRLEYDDAGTTWIKSTRITAEDVSLDTPPEVHERSDDGHYALASGLEDAEVADEAAGTRTRLTAVIGADERPPSTVHYHPDLDGSDELLKVEIKSGEYRETVRNRVSTAIHVGLSDEALVWVDGTPITEDGDTAAGSIQRTESGDSVIRTMTDESGEATVRVVQDPSVFDRISHRFGMFFASISLSPWLFDGTISTASVAAPVGGAVATAEVAL